MHRIIAAVAMAWMRMFVMLRAVHLRIGLVAMLAGCNGTPAAFEEAARAAAMAIGADDLTVLDSITRFPQDGGRTVRFTIAGDPIAIVPLELTRPDACTPKADCAAQLTDDIAYAKGQSAYAARIVKAFAPCGFRAVTNLQLINVGLERKHQNTRASVWLDRSLDRETGPSILAEVDDCAAALAEGDANARFETDDVSRWGSRLAAVDVQLTDLSTQPDGEPPLMLSWEKVAVDDWDGSGPPIVVADYRLEGGEAKRRNATVRLGLDAQTSLDAQLAADAQAWLATQDLSALGIAGPLTARPRTSAITQDLVDDDPTRVRYLIGVQGPDGAPTRDLAIAATRDFAAGTTTDFRIVRDVIGPDGIERLAVLKE